MADIFCRSVDGNNANDGSTRALAKKTLEDNGMSSAGDGAMIAAGAGGRVFCADDHAQTEAATITLSGGTINAPIQILSTDFSTNGSGVPDLKAGASIIATGGGSITFNSYLYSYGITYSTNDDFIFATIHIMYTFERGIMKFTGAGGKLFLNGGERVTFLDTEVNFNISSQGFRVNIGHLRWFGGSVTGISPATLIDIVSLQGRVEIRDVDLSIISGNLLDPVGGVSLYSLLLERCKIHPSLTILQRPISTGGVFVKLHSSDSEDTTIAIHEEHYEGTIIDETTIVRTGGMSDGTTPLSLKMTTNANAIEFLQPLVSPPIADWTDRTSLTNFDIEIAIDSATILNNNDVWMELESPGSDAQGIITSTKLSNILGTPTELTASPASWPNLSGSGKKYRLRATVTPGKVGPITARIYSAKPSVSIYYDSIITQS